MKLTAIIIVLACLVPAALALSPEECASAGQRCATACCGNLGGSQSGEDFPCTLYTDAGTGQYLDCHSDCVENKIRCTAPTSGCDGQYSSCASGCSGSTDQRWSCMKSCALSGTVCAQDAGNGDGNGDGNTGCCCGSGLVLLFGAAGVLLAGRIEVKK